MDAIEALAACIMQFEGFYMPGSTTGGVKGSTSWRNRNPGNLRIGPLMRGKDNKGYAVYDTLSQGWSDLKRDLSYKISGRTTHNLGLNNNLHDLFSTYAPPLDNNDPTQYSRQVALMMTKIYNIQITPETKLNEIMALPVINYTTTNVSTEATTSKSQPIQATGETAGPYNQKATENKQSTK